MFPCCSNKKISILLTLTMFAVTACGGGGGGSGGDGGNRVDPSGEWLVPTQWVADGGPGVDGIPAIENPTFESAATIGNIAPNELVIALRIGGQVKVYPHAVMNYHEVVNDGPADAPFTMSYCPLTGSAVAWFGKASAVDPSFGVSGLLYNSNLLLYDRETQSLWSQMLQLTVNGTRIREVPEVIQAIETNFETLQAMYPAATVMTRNTGHSRPYDQPPYGNYLNEPGLLFQVFRADNRMEQKQRVIGIFEGDSAKVYQLGAFGTLTRTINDQFNNQSIVAIGNSALNFAAIYSRVLADGTILSFDPIQDDLPNVMTDSEGNVWDIFGSAVSGPRVGTQLDSTRSYTALWFAWVAHFRTVDIIFN
jgi:hypothetical protein